MPDRLPGHSQQVDNIDPREKDVIQGARRLPTSNWPLNGERRPLAVPLAITVVLLAGLMGVFVILLESVPR